MRWFAGLSRFAQAAILILAAAIAVAAVNLVWGHLLAALVAAGLVLLTAGLAAYAVGAAALRRRRIGSFGNDLVAELGRKFTTGVETVHATERGLYELPWYVLVGEPGAGKTEAIRHSGIGFPPGLNEPSQGRGGTVNMDWWLAKKAVLLDTAGRLMFEATAEWRSFLQLLKTHRPLTPINGMILAIPVTSLQSDEPAKIAEKAAQIAAQFDAVQRTLDVRFPVYVLITKADRIGGFREFFHNLEHSSAQNQLLGWSNPAELDEPFDATSIESHLNEIADRLRRRRLALLAEPRTLVEHAPRLDQVDSLYAFPAELMRLGPRLQLYLESIFGSSRSGGATPLFLRGVFFTSAMSEGAALDVDLAESFGLDATTIPAEMRIFEREKSYFLRDFFLDKCFPEGGLVTTAANVSRAVRRRRIATIVCAAVAVGGLAAASVAAYVAMQSSVGEHAAFWSAVASRQRFQQAPSSWERDKPLAWFQLFDPATGAYRGEQPLGPPYPPSATVADLHRQAQLLALHDVQVPGMFALWDRAGHGQLNADRRDAHRLLAEQGIYRPLVAAALARIAAPSGSSAKGIPDRPAILAAAIAAVAPLLAGSPAAGTNVDPLYALVLNPQQRDRLFATLPDHSLGQLRMLEAAVGRAWPPPVSASTDLASIAGSSILRQSQSLVDRIQSLQQLAAALTRFHSAEQRLLALRSVCTIVPSRPPSDYRTLLAQWRRDVNALADANSALRQPLAQYDHATGSQPLATTYANLQNQRANLFGQFDPLIAAFGGDASRSLAVRSLQARRQQVQYSIDRAWNRLAAILPLWNPAQSPDAVLAEIDNQYVTPQSRSNRLDAYQAEMADDLYRPAPALPQGWRSFASAARTAIATPAPIQLGPGDADDAARQLIAAAAACAAAHRRDQLAAAAGADLPSTAAAWAHAVQLQRGSGSAASVQLPALPLGLPPVAAPDEDDPTAAATVTGELADFLAAWPEAGSSVDSTAQGSALFAARNSFAAYLADYARWWHAAGSDVTVQPLRWEQAVSAAEDQSLPTTAAAAIQSRTDRARHALAQLVAALRQEPDWQATLQRAQAGLVADDGGAGLQIWAQWRQIAAGGGDALEARRRLLALDPQTLRLLFAGDIADPTMPRQLAYWKSASAQFLAALRGPALAAQHRPVAHIPVAAAFPIEPWSPGCPTLSVGQVTALFDRLDADSALPANPAPAANAEQQDPAADFPPAVRANFLSLRDLDPRAGADIPDAQMQQKLQRISPMLRHLLAPHSPIPVNLYLLPVSQQLDLEAALGPANATRSAAELLARLPMVQFVSGESGALRRSAAESVSDLQAATQLYHTTFPHPGESALQLSPRPDAAPGAVCALDGGPWWPLVALRDGHPQPVGGEAGGARRFWYVRVWVEPAGGAAGAAAGEGAADRSAARRWPMWIGLDFGTEVDPAKLWPSVP